LVLALSAAMGAGTTGASQVGSVSASAVETRLVQAVASREAGAIELLRGLVEINSGTMNFAGVQEVGARLRAEFDELGFVTRWEDGTGFGRAGHLVARRPAGSEGAPKVVLIGHLDTVFEPSSPFQGWQRVDGQEGFRAVRGPGVTDMKGGDVVLLVALQALAEVGLLDQLDVRVVLTGDEEKAGEPLHLARAALLAEAEGALLALGFEDGDSDPRTAVIARRGASSWTVRVRGTAAHSSQIFQPAVGAGAIFEISRVLDEFRRVLVAIPNLTFNPGVILGGTELAYESTQARGEAFGKSNVVAELATVTGDLRALSPEDLAQARQQMIQIVAQSLPGTVSEIEFSDGYPPMAPTNNNRRLLALYDQASRDHGLGGVTAVDPRNAGAADISFVAGEVPYALDGLGLMGRGGHTVDETADLRTLVTQAQRAAVLLARVAGGELSP
jgi:glutamate carboxypeptidase